MPGVSLISTDFVFNVNTSLSQTNAHILHRSDGGALVYWSVPGQDGHVQGRLITPTGGLVSNAFNASVDIDFYIGGSNITAAELTNGGFAFSSNTGTSVGTATYDATGLSGFAQNFSFDPAVYGNLVTETTSDGRIATFISTSAGELASFGTSAFDNLNLNNGSRISTRDQSGGYWNVIDAAGIGSSAMALATARSGGALIDLHIVSAGTLSDTSGPISVPLGAGYALGSFKLAEMPSGNFLASWRDGTTLDAQQYNASGQAVGPLMQSSGSAPNHLSVTALPDGHVLMTWDNFNSSFGYDIWGQLFTSAGTAEGERFLIDVATTGDQTDPSAAVLANGDIVVIYNSANGAVQHTMARVLSLTRPDAGDDSVTVGSGHGTALNLLANDRDPNGLAISIASNTAPAHGTVSLLNGVLTYTPNGGYAGTDFFTYKILNSQGGNDTAGVSVLVHRTPVADFDGDGRSDILWRHDNGQFGDWLGTANGALAYNAAAGLLQVTNDWHIVGMADVNGDGRSDILWRNDNGQFGNWLAGASGGFAYNAAAGITNISNDWHVAGFGDFNGDGRADVLWRNDNGQFGDWLANAGGGFGYNAAAGVVQVSNDWHIAGVGDFNGDGRSDILWRNDNGQFGDWLANAGGGFGFNTAAGVRPVSTDWHIIGTGDFNGDGRSDILWRNDNGLFGDWLANASGGFDYNAAAGVTQVSTDWHIAAIGDYNGDGRDDILWRHNNGSLGNWLATAAGGFAYNPGAGQAQVTTDWHLQSTVLLI